MAGQSHHKAIAESRTQKVEIEAEIAQSHPKPHQCDIKAPLKRVDSQPIGTPRLPQGYPKATSRLPQGYPKATPRLHQGYLNATFKPPPSQGIRLFTHHVSRFKYSLKPSNGAAFPGYPWHSQDITPPSGGIRFHAGAGAD